MRAFLLQQHERLQRTQPAHLDDASSLPRGDHSGRWNGETPKPASAGASLGGGSSRDSRERSRAGAPPFRENRNGDTRDSGDAAGRARDGGSLVSDHAGPARRDEQEHWNEAHRERADVEPAGGNRLPGGWTSEHGSWNNEAGGGVSAAPRQCSRARDVLGPSRASDSGRQEAVGGAEQMYRDGRERGRGSGRGHWKAHHDGRGGFQASGGGKAGARGGGARDTASLTDWRAVEAEKRRGDRAREVQLSGAGRDAGLQHRSSGTSRSGSGQGGRGRDMSGSVSRHGENRGMSVAGPGHGGDRRARETSVRPGQFAATSGSGGRAAVRAGRAGGNDYSKLAAPKSTASSSGAPAGVAASAIGYAAFAASATPTVSRPSGRGRSSDGDPAQQRSAARPTAADDARPPSFHYRGNSGSPGGQGASETSRHQGESRAFQASIASISSRTLRSRSPPQHSTRRSASPNRSTVQGRADDFTAGGGGDDAYQRPGKPRSKWEQGRGPGRGGGRGMRSASIRRAGPDGPKPWKDRAEYSTGRDGDRLDARSDINKNRGSTSGGHRGNFPERIDGTGGGRGRGRGRGRFGNRSKG